ncbi:MAG: hypothetical protein OEY97_04910 [Nitrospirota bacterium]|nr:hypothetical protein [Nitrospirota bacterium]
MPPKPHTAPLPVTTRIGQLPPTWDHSAVFFADLYAIFYGEPEKTRELQRSVSGFFGYGGRLIPMLDLLYRGSGNVLILHQEPEPATLDYFRRLGLSLPQIEILDHTRFPTFLDGIRGRPDLVKSLGGHPAEVIDGYVTDRHLEYIALDLNKPLVNSYRQGRDANNKVLLHRFLAQAGMPMFDGGEFCPGDGFDDIIRMLSDMGYGRAVVRSSLGASGFGVATLDLDVDFDAGLPGHLMDESCVLVQGWVEPGRLGITRVSSPSVQFFIGDHGIELFDLTGQLLKDASVHEGNITPPVDLPGDPGVVDEILEQSRRVVTWVAGTGYRGTGSIDFLVYSQTKKTRVVVCEVNARVTGATYPSLLARHFRPGRAWLMRNFGFEPVSAATGLLERLERSGLLYLPGNREGVLPINCIPDENGRIIKAQLLFLADTPERCLDMIDTCQQTLPDARHDERD